jgi:hypothetical protein
VFGSRVLPSQPGHVGLEAAWETGEMLFLAWLCVGAEEASTVEGGKRWRCVRIVCAAAAGWVWRDTTVDYAAGQRPQSTRCHEMIVLAAGDGSEQSQCIAYSSLRHASGLFVVESTLLWITSSRLCRWRDGTSSRSDKLFGYVGAR